MTLPEFIDAVRLMRRDQADRDAHRTAAAATLARYSEKLVDDYLAAVPPDVPAEPDCDTPTLIEAKP